MMQWLLNWADSLTPMQIIGVVLVALIVGKVLGWSKANEYKNFKIIYMITNKEGFPDNDKMREWGLYFLLCYGFLWQLWKGSLSEWYVGVLALLVGGKGAYAMKTRSDQGRTETLKMSEQTGTNGKTMSMESKSEPPKSRNPLEGSMSG